MSELGMSDETLSIEGLMEDAPGAEVSAGTPAFLDHFTDEATRGYMERKGFKDVQALGASFASLERMMSGGRVPLPSGEDDADGYARAFSALGRPETAAEYGFGELAGAESGFREALRVQPRFALPHARLGTLLRERLPESDLKALETRLADTDLGLGPRARLLFALAQVRDGRGDFAGAAECLREANAAVLEKAGGAMRLDQSAFTPKRLAADIAILAAEPKRLAAMAEAARLTGAIDAAERLADLVMQVGGLRR